MESSGETPSPVPVEPVYPVQSPAVAARLAVAAGRAAWVAGITLALSAFMGWYSGSAAEGPTVSVLGWNTGTLGKFVFVIGIAVILLAIQREVGIELPRSLPESVILIVLGTTATILLLIRIIAIPDEFAGTGDRAIGLWTGLTSAVIVIVAGFVKAGEEL
jgi:hypothetical protein